MHNYSFKVVALLGFVFATICTLTGVIEAKVQTNHHRLRSRKTVVEDAFNNNAINDINEEEKNLQILEREARFNRIEELKNRIQFLTEEKDSIDTNYNEAKNAVLLQNDNKEENDFYDQTKNRLDTLLMLVEARTVEEGMGNEESNSDSHQTELSLKDARNRIEILEDKIESRGINHDKDNKKYQEDINDEFRTSNYDDQNNVVDDIDQLLKVRLEDRINSLKKEMELENDLKGENKGLENNDSNEEVIEIENDSEEVELEIRNDSKEVEETSLSDFDDAKDDESKSVGDLELTKDSLSFTVIENVAEQEEEENIEIEEEERQARINALKQLLLNEKATGRTKDYEEDFEESDIEENTMNILDLDDINSSKAADSTKQLEEEDKNELKDEIHTLKDDIDTQLSGRNIHEDELILFKDEIEGMEQYIDNGKKDGQKNEDVNVESFKDIDSFEQLQYEEQQNEIKNEISALKDEVHNQLSESKSLHEDELKALKAEIEGMEQYLNDGESNNAEQSTTTDGVLSAHTQIIEDEQKILAGEKEIVDIVKGGTSPIELILLGMGVGAVLMALIATYLVCCCQKDQKKK